MFVPFKQSVYKARVFGKAKCTRRQWQWRYQWWGRHIQGIATCRSIYNRDRNGIKQSTTFLGVDQGSRWLPNGKNQGITDTKEAQLPLCLVNQLIKSFRRGQSSDQQRSLFPPQTLQKTTYEWLQRYSLILHLSRDMYMHVCMNIMWKFVLTKLFWPKLRVPVGQ